MILPERSNRALSLSKVSLNKLLSPKGYDNETSISEGGLVMYFVCCLRAS